jgi:capsular polysaccharide biosynthesis protein
MSVAYITVEKDDITGKVEVIVSGDPSDALDIANHIVESAVKQQAGYTGVQDVETH